MNLYNLYIIIVVITFLLHIYDFAHVTLMEESLFLFNGLPSIVKEIR